MMSAAAAATGSVLGTEVDDLHARPRRFAKTEEESAALLPADVLMTTASLSLLGEPCRLIQLVPNAFLVRLTGRRARATSSAKRSTTNRGAIRREFDADSLRRRCRSACSAELGRTRPSRIGPRGRPSHADAVVELDRAADDPVDLKFVSGRACIGRGSARRRRRRVGPVTRSTGDPDARSPPFGCSRRRSTGLMARVLRVVDDAAFVRKMLGDALSEGGHDVIGEATNGTGGRAPLRRAASPTSPRSTSPMPEKDGLDGPPRDPGPRSLRRAWSCAPRSGRRARRWRRPCFRREGGLRGQALPVGARPRRRGG